MSSLALLPRSDTDFFAAGLGAALARAVAPARLAAAGLLVVFVGLFALPLQAQAQTVTTFVSNTAQGSGGASNHFQAQRFATGTNTGGYTISEVQVRLNTTASRSTSVKIRKNNATNKPGDLVATLTNPGTLTGGSENTFTAPPDTTLDASTNYWISVNEGITIAGDRASVARTTSDVETGETGWSIDNTRLTRSSETAGWSTNSQGPLVIAVKGTANPTTTSSDATLSALTLSKGTLSPPFSSGVTTYTASVGDSVSRIKVTGTAADDANASVAYLDVDGNLLTDADAADGHQVDLDVGDNVIQVQVTAEDTTTETYTVTVTRAEFACTAPDLSGRLEVWTATMTVGLGEDGDYFGYSSSESAGTLSDRTIDYRGSNYTISDVKHYPGDFLNIFLNKSIPAVDRDRLRLHVCGDTFDLASADDQTGDYFSWYGGNYFWSTGITVSLALSATASSDATLSALALSDGALSPSFASDVTDYTASAANAASRITVTAARSDSAADIDYLDGDGDELTDLDPGTDGHQVDLVVGENVIQVKLTAEDGTTKTYKVTVTRAAGVSTDANLSALTLSKGTLSPSFASDVIAYAASVGDSVSRITVTAARSDSAAEIAYLDGDDIELADLDTVADGHQVDLVVGANTIKVKVTAGDGATTKTYTMTVTRAAQSNTDATLSAIALADVNGAAIALSPSFASNVIVYRASVPLSVRAITITVATRDSAATVQFGVDREDGLDFDDDEDFEDPETVADGYRHRTALSSGDNVIYVKVTAGDGTTTKTYTVTVSVSGTEFTCLPPDLSGRTEVWTGTLTVGSDSGLYGYSLPLGYGALSNTSFDYRENSYTIKEIYEFGESTGTENWMVLNLDPYFPNSERDTMRLHLCNDTFDLVEAGGSQSEGNYAWSNASFLDWSHATTIEMALTADNVAPVFEDGATASRGFDEDLEPGEPFGTPVIATDDEMLVYSLEGTDAALFDIGADGVLLTRVGESYDHETKSLYEITVKADDGKGETATIAVTVNVGDVDEPPEAPAEPTVTPVAGSTTSLSVTWTEPSNKGPAIDGYDLRYRVTGTSGWTDGPEDVTATTETLTGLAVGTSYGVQVLATNAEGDGAWSVEGTGRTGANTPATGKPSISGTAQVGQMLTAWVRDIMDDDGFPTYFTYQWVRVDSSNNETDVGTESITYSPASSDVGSTIKVEVSFTDGAGNAETVTSDATAAVVAAAGPCPADNDWCATMTVEVVSDIIIHTGYSLERQGALDDTTIDYGSKSFTVAFLATRRGSGDEYYVEIGFVNAVEFLPLGSVFNFGGTEFTADATSEQTVLSQYQWDSPSDLPWIDGQKVTVSANLAPAPESATVDGTSLVLTHAEDLDTASTPAASAYVVKVNGGTGPAVSGVSVGARTVTLTLADAVTAADTVTVDYDAPASNRLRDVSGLDAPAFDNFPVTNNTGATNTVATGQPGISGTAAVGQTLTATTSDITDADGNTNAEDGDTGYAYTYQWILVDGNTETDISGETSSTYTPSSSDVGKTIRVRVSFTDDLDYAEGPFTSEQTAAVTEVTVDVSIAAEHDRIGAGLEDLVFTLTREGATTAALPATVTIDQDESWLINSDRSHTVTFVAGSATATLTLGASLFSFEPETSGDLTATVSGAGIAGDEATVEMVSTAYAPITVSYDKSSYTFAEDAANVNIYVVATLDPVYPRAPSRTFYGSFSTVVDTAGNDDFVVISWQPQFVQGDFALDDSKYVARKRLQHSDGTYFGVENDDVYEGTERFAVNIALSAGLPFGLAQFVRPNGDTCLPPCTPEVEYTVTITDEEDRSVLSLAADPASITEEDDDTTTSVTENVSVLTVSAASPKTFATDQAITLTFAGTAVYGTHYSVDPADTDANATGHQVVLPAETASVEVTVTATTNDTADGDRSILVTGSRDGTAFGTATTITLLDDETTTAGICARTPEVRDALVALISGVDDCAGVTATHLADITGDPDDGIDLSRSGIVALKAGDFAGLTSLTDLTLAGNSLASLGAGVFDGLTSLQSLSLDDNELASLNAGVFNDLTSLTSLSLGKHSLASLPAGVFAGLTSLTSLDLIGNGVLASLPAGVFDDLMTSLTYLNLSGNSLASLPAGVFAGLTSLQSLYLSDNLLASLNAGVFDDLTSLTLLTLNGNALNMLPNDVFADLTRLTTLWLQDNPGVPFAPTADALPDDGTVSDAGGMVTLDGSGSGGAWGTNVTYSWVLTPSTSGVTFDDNTSATPEVTIPALAADTVLTFTLTVTGKGGTNGIDTDTDTATVTVTGTTTTSTDATLSGLTLQDGEGAVITLSPTFPSDTTTDYTAQVLNGIDTVTLTATQNDSTATVAIANDDDTSKPGEAELNLDVGSNTLTVTVTAEDGTTKTYTVTVTRAAANTAPTATDSLVTTDEDTAHHFAADEFNFDDTDADDTLASVTVVTLPAVGALALNSTAVTAGRVVAAADIVTLVFTPAQDANGTSYASFTFRVSDGTDESDADYIMTVNVTAVNDVATGKPTIMGTAQVGQELTAHTDGISDPDGKTKAENGDADYAYTYQWIRVDGANEIDISGETSRAYTLMADDIGMTVKVKVTFVDDADNDEDPLISDAYPSSGTIATAGICARTPAVREELVSLISGVDDCASVTATHLADIIEIDLSRSSIADLMAGDFAGLTALMELNLAGNLLASLPAGVFDGLASLTSLSLDDNGLESLHDDVFADLTSLTSLSLDDNSLASLPAGVFADLTSLTELALAGNSLASLPTGVFDSLTLLTYLNLTDNKLASLSAGVFDGLTSLQSLYLTDNLLASLNAGVFDDLTSLTLLTLNGNALNMLPNDVFADLTRLTTLWLQDNPGVPFAPTAEALPDDGTVSDEGGTVTLDGSDSGGAWGTNVTYSWVLTPTTNGVTFDDNTSATPEVVIPALAADTVLTFTLTVTGKGGTSGIDTDTDTATVTVTGTTTTSTDATLSGLTLQDGEGTVITLSPTFPSDMTTDYTAQVANGVEAVTLTATKNDSTATVAIANDDDTSKPGEAELDLDVGTNTLTVTVTAEDGTTKTYTVTVTREVAQTTNTDATAAGVTVTETALTVAEEDTDGDSYTVVLDTEPTASVTVTVAGHAGTDVTPDPATLTFTASNWDTARTVTVTAADDADTTNDTVLLTHRATSTDSEYSGIVIAEVTVTVNDNDTAPGPVVTGAHLASGPGSDGVWSAGDTVEAVVEFSEAVTVDTAGRAPTLAIEFGAQRREAVYASGTGTAALVFHHVVAQADDGARAARVVAGGLLLNGATIRNAAGVDAELGFVLAPAVTSVAVAPDPDGDGRWSPGEALAVTVGFSDEVAVDTSGGTPSVAVLAGVGERGAVYSTGSGTATLRFAYTVTTDDGAVTSVQALANGLALNGGAIVGATGLAAALAHAGASRTGTPAAPALSVADASAAEGGTLVFAVTLDRAAAAVVVVGWATGDRTARAGEDYVADSGKIAFVPGETLRTVRVAVLEDDEVESAETMELTLSNATGAGLADATATGRVSGPAGEQPAVSVADAKVREGPGAVLAFKVTLDRVPPETVTVDWETLDGAGKAGAKAGQDYVADAGTLVFVPGETAKTVHVAVFDDAHDEGREVMLLILSNAVRATIDDAVAKGTIENSDHMPKAWLARFGRTVAEQVLEAVEDRLRAAPRTGGEARLAGEALPLWDGGTRPGSQSVSSGEDARDAAALAKVESARSQGRLAALTDWLRDDPDPWSGADSGDGKRDTLRSRAVTSRDFLTGTSFEMTEEAAGGAGLVSLWGRGALTRFDGRERGPNGDLTLEGEVGSAMLGADWTSGAGFRSDSGAGAWTAGLLLAHSRGEGSYRGEMGDTGDTSGTEGTVFSSVTGLYPYGRYRVTNRVTLWGVAGYGAGTLTLTPEDADGKAVAPLRTDMELMMAALGVRGVAIEAPADGGFELAGTSDAMVVRTSSEKTSGLMAATGDVTRLRLGLEGVWRGLAFGGHELEPSLEVGIRHDGGDAETGFGVDIGAGLAWSHANSGVSAEVSARGLLTHAADGFREQGIAGSLTWDPRPETERGALLTLRQTMGAQASGGMDALLGHTTLAGLAANDDDDELQNRRLELKLGYGFPVFSDRFTSTPEIELGFSDRARDYSLGWRLTLAPRDAGTLELGVVATRRESANDEPRHVIGFQLTARW